MSRMTTAAAPGSLQLMGAMQVGRRHCTAMCWAWGAELGECCLPWTRPSSTSTWGSATWGAFLMPAAEPQIKALMRFNHLMSWAQRNLRIFFFTADLSASHSVATCFEWNWVLTSALGSSIQFHLSMLLATCLSITMLFFFFTKWVTQSNSMSVIGKYVLSLIFILSSAVWLPSRQNSRAWLCM